MFGTSLQLLLNEGKDGFWWRGGIWSLTEWGEPSGPPLHLRLNALLKAQFPGI